MIWNPYFDKKCIDPMPSEWITIPSARRIGRRSTLMSKKADRRPLIEHEAPVSHSQSSDTGPAAVRKQAATPADSEARGSLVVEASAAAADEDGEEEDGVLDFFL